EATDERVGQTAVERGDVWIVRDQAKAEGGLEQALEVLGGAGGLAPEAERLPFDLPDHINDAGGRERALLELACDVLADRHLLGLEQARLALLHQHFAGAPRDVRLEERAGDRPAVRAHAEADVVLEEHVLAREVRAQHVVEGRPAVPEVLFGLGRQRLEPELLDLLEVAVAVVARDVTVDVEEGGRDRAFACAHGVTVGRRGRRRYHGGRGVSTGAAALTPLRSRTGCRPRRPRTL